MPEQELDSLLNRLEQSKQGNPSQPPVDPLERLRVQILEDLMPVVMELSEKYKSKGVSLRMEAGNFLQGGRKVGLEFSFGAFKTCLHGTVTDEGIAFEEVRYAPNIDGELASGPMLRLRQLNAESFRVFLCDQLASLLRAAIRRA